MSDETGPVDDGTSTRVPNWMILVGLGAFTVGGATGIGGSYLTNASAADSELLHNHIQLGGHAVMESRMANVEQELARINGRLDGFEAVKANQLLICEKLEVNCRR